MAKTIPQKRAGFFCELPLSTIDEIKRRSGPTKPQWVVIQEAFASKAKRPASKLVVVTVKPKAKKRSGK